MTGFSSWRVSTRMHALLVLVMLGLLCLSAAMLFQMRSTMLEDRKEKTRNLVEAAVGAVKQFHSMALAGTLSEADAKRQALDVLRQQRYQDGNYFFVYSGNVTRLMFPPDPSTEGSSSYDLKDAKGAYMLRDMVTLAHKRADFYQYWFPRAGNPQPSPKMSYVMLFEPWDWTIGTGIYLDDVDAAFQRGAVVLCGLCALLMALFSVIGWKITRGVLSQLGGEPAVATAIMERVASGDLSASVDGADEGSLLGALNGMVASLRTMVRRIDDSADALTRDASAISAAVCQVAATSERQTKAASCMSAGMQELAVSSAEISERAGESERDSRSSLAIAQQGAERVTETTEAIEQINRTVAASTACISSLSARAGEVSSIAHVIKEIAAQTNLLALNAAIEAARAGEQGRGFAVVADAVRKLAERTAAATAEIEQTISAIQGETDQAVSAMTAVQPEVERGVALSNAAAEALHSIADSAKRTLGHIEHVASATREQNISCTDIASQVDMIARTVEETAASTRATAASTERLEAISVHLKDQLRHFRLGSGA